MARLPLNFLLYTVSLGLLGGVGWIFYQATIEVPKTLKARRDRIDPDVKSLIDSGQKRQPPELTWVYGTGTTNDPWWAQFKNVNWIGKLPPAPEKAASAPQTVKTTGPDVKLDDLLSVAAICARGNLSSCVVRYKPTMGVQPPAPPMGAASDVISAPLPSAAPARPTTPGPAGRQQPSMPTAAVDPSSLLVHHLKLEDTLWAPYGNFRLVEVAPDASRVFFVREKEGVPKEEWKKEEVLRGEFSMSDDVSREVSKVTGRKAESRASAPRPAPAQTSSWVPVEETREMERGHWHVSERDYRDLQERGNRILEEDLIVSSYSSPGGELRGVMVEKVSPELARYGVQRGDVIVSINETPVRSKAEAMTEGKKQYDRGTRDFKVVMVSGGERVERWFHAPNK